MPNEIQHRNPTRLETLRSEQERLNTCLQSATPAEVSKALLILFSAFPAQDKGEGEELRIGAYELALGEASRHVLDSVLRDVLQGRIPELNRAYAPTPAHLAKLCRDRTDELRG